MINGDITRMKLSLAHNISMALALSMLLFTGTRAEAAEGSFIPSIAVSEEYTDNVFGSDLNIRSDFITSFMPGFVATYKAPLWDCDLGYRFDYRYYAQNSRSADSANNINANGLVRIIDEKVFLQLSDIYKQVSLDVTRDTTSDSLNGNQTSQNIGTVSPFLVLRPTSNSTVKTGYRYINTWYKDPASVSKEDHQGFINLSYDLSPKIIFTTDYTFTHEIPETGATFNRHEVLAGPRYEYADKSFIFAQGGVIATTYTNGNNTLNPAWKAGITHTVDTFVAAATGGTSYTDNPDGASTFTTNYALSLTKNIQQGSVTLRGSYTKYADGETEQTTTESISSGISGLLEVLPGIKVNLGFTYENYHDVQIASYTNKYFVDSGISWLIGKDLNLGLTYKFIQYTSDQAVSDNYEINRVRLEVRKTF